MFYIFQAGEIFVFRSNVMGTHFTLYDNGENPGKAPVIGEGVRQELSAVIYVRIYTVLSLITLTDKTVHR